MLHIDRGLIRSKCDNGFSIHTSASKSDLDSLNFLHYKALRSACEAYPTAAYLNLYFLCNEFPAALNRKLVLIKFLIHNSKNDYSLFKLPPVNCYSSYMNKRLTLFHQAIFGIYLLRITGPS